jgi:KipI family sensor histidine kinase inhibitor
MIHGRPLFYCLGGDIIHIEVGDEISIECNEIVRRLFAAVRRLTGVSETVQAYASLSFRFDPRKSTLESMKQEVEKALNSRDADATPKRVVKVPVCYEDQFAPDLAWISSEKGLPREEIVKIHCSKRYTCMMLGYTPGFVFLDDVSPEIAVPRLETPRIRVPTGSIGIAGSQTGIYGVEAPGGWRLIGRTPLLMFDPDRDPPTLIEPGDNIEFEPISAAEFMSMMSSIPKRRTTRTGTPILQVLQAGLITTVQDLGRTGYRHLGVPRSGGLDRLSQCQANYIIGNPAETPTLEIIGGRFRARVLEDIVIAVTGAESPLKVNDKTMETYSAIRLRKGDDISLGWPLRGFVNYLAIAGVWDVDYTLGSFSTYVRAAFGGLEGRPLKAGDIIRATRLFKESPDRKVPEGERIGMSTGIKLRMTPGPYPADQSGNFDRIHRASFKVSEASDRMGFRTKPSGANSPSLVGGQVLTIPTYPGYVQVPPDGCPIILQQDGQTSGGYFVTGVVLPEDMCRLSQLRPGEEFAFEQVGPEQAIREVTGFCRLLERYNVSSLL